MPINENGERRRGATYQKVISILFAGLLGASGLIWNNSQNQIKSSLDRVDKLTETIIGLQKEMITMNYKMEMLQYRVDQIDDKIGTFSNEREKQPSSSPRFERK